MLLADATICINFRRMFANGVENTAQIEQFQSIQL